MKKLEMADYKIIEEYLNKVNYESYNYGITTIYTMINEYHTQFESMNIM